MSKRKKYKRKVKLSYSEIIFIKLKHFSLAKSTNEEDKQKAKSLIKWFHANNFFTAAQTALANSLTYVNKKTAVVKKHYLYAVSNGVDVKLGMSGDVNKRLKGLQTSSSSELVLLWKYYIANTSKEAIKIEKMLHRACKEFHIRGEWFTMDCISTVNKFNPNKNHSAKWEFAKLITVQTRNKGNSEKFEVSNIRRNRLNKDMKRVWDQESAADLLQLEIKKHLDDGHVVLVTYE